MAIPISKSDLVSVHSLAEVNRWAKANDDNVSVAISKGWGEIRSAALNKYQAVSFDALTPETLPDLVKGYAVDLASDWLSSGSGRPAEIDTRATRARVWLSFLATGKDHSLDDAVLEIGTSTGSASVRVGAPGQLRFDADDPLGGLRRRVWPI
jgi:hypothetical protein